MIWQNLKNINNIMEKKSKIYVAGHKGLVGSAILRELEKQGYTNLIYKTRKELDLANQLATTKFFMKERPEYVFLAAARVGGILANDTYPAEFINDNLAIQTNTIRQAYKNKVKKLLFLGSSCVYPKKAPQPIKEEYLLTGELEPTNKAYAVAKIAGIEMCQAYNRQFGTNYVSVMPTNTYGPNDNFDPDTSHVLPGLIGKFHKAKETNDPNVTLWGTGSPKREFIHVDDLAKACIFLMKNYEGDEIVNIGTGKDITITELAEIIKKIVGYEGEITWDKTKPDGTPRKLLDVSRLHRLGWHETISLEDGIQETYEWYMRELIK
jgi:GDP-L-fucose synthase